jgi:hypothetical protein
LFAVMVGLMLAASVAIWTLWPRLFPSTAQISAQLKFDDNLARLTEAQRLAVLGEQRRKLEKPDVRASAREIFDRNLGGGPPGFLAETGSIEEVRSAAAAYLKLVDSLKLVEKRPVIQFVHRSATDGEGDVRRVRALVEAMYAENKPMADAASRINSVYRQKEALLARYTDRLEKDVKPTVEAARNEFGDDHALAAKRAAVQSLQRKEKELSERYDETMARVRSATADLKAAESGVPNVDVGDDQATAAAKPGDQDPQVADLSQKVSELSTALATKKQERTGKADEARKSLDAALKAFEQDVAKGRASMKGDSDLSRYLEAAARIQSQLKAVSGELAQQQRSDMERLTMLKRKLGEKNEARIRAAFAGDPELQTLQTNLALKERQFNAATNSGSKDDARALEKDVDTLKQAIEARQDLLTTADGVAPGAKELEDVVNDMLKRMEGDRSRNDRRMAEMLSELAAQAPKAGSLTAEQKAFAEQLEKRQAALNKARERYAAAADAAAAETDQEVKKLEGELAAAQAKIDERRKQVADAARQTMSQEQQAARVAAVTAAKRALERAQKADEAAAQAYAANHRVLAQAIDDVEASQRRMQAYERERGKQAEIESNIQVLGKEVDRLRQQVQASVMPLPPDERSVDFVAAKEDRRATYMLGTNLVLMLLFVPLILLAPAHAGLHHDEGEAHESFPGHIDFAFATAAPRRPDDRALAAARRVEDATARHAGLEDDSEEGTPLPV